MDCTCEGYGVVRYGDCAGTHTRDDRLRVAAQAVVTAYDGPDQKVRLVAAVDELEKVLKEEN